MNLFVKLVNEDEIRKISKIKGMKMLKKKEVPDISQTFPFFTFTFTLFFSPFHGVDMICCDFNII